MSITSIIPPQATRPKNPSKPIVSQLVELLEINLNLSTTLLIGACIQSALILLLPNRYAFAPAILLLAVRVIDVTLVTIGWKTNPHVIRALPTRTSAQVLDSDGNFNGPGSEQIAVLLLGSKSNHPLGFFAPGYEEVGDYAKRMYEELESPQTQENGFLGHTSWNRKADNGAHELLIISYWRSIEDVHNYAHGPLHKKAWLWWDQTTAKHGHIGLMHEVFEAPRGMWEAVYLNFQPTLLGATTFLKKGDKLEGGNVSEEWVSGLMDAGRGPMTTSRGRRGLNAK